VLIEQPDEAQEEQGLKFEFSVGPNPVVDLMQLSLNLTDDVKNGSIKILQLDGKELYKEGFSGKKGFNTNTVNVNHLPTGIYFIAIEFADEVHLRKMMKI